MEYMQISLHLKRFTVFFFFFFLCFSLLICFLGLLCSESRPTRCIGKQMERVSCWLALDNQMCDLLAHFPLFFHLTLGSPFSPPFFVSSRFTICSLTSLPQQLCALAVRTMSPGAFSIPNFI